ncbi:TonB-dependent siderophore receptor [Microvirga terrae]|uniref:TonB-dependent siderophore receptor n=1 Tax=Microvirga terrae TaxID=2740529 RepID=A0ABY5RWQ3_9HYPH|nr:TonB-dependent siderophore receptor [Microvirga terrae]UVF21705.1 TonB-dependent siderophore receptor [Microvirga terrae]
MKFSLALLASSALMLTSSDVFAQPLEERAVQLEEVTVEGSRSGQEGDLTANGYVATSTRSATKTDTLILETPQSISTVTHEQLEDRKPQTLLDAVSYTPGVRTGGYGFDPRYDAFSIRGIDVTYTGVFRDGLRQVNSPNGLFRLEPYGLEGITILRGPAASIYGASSTGGIVDLISKRPTFFPFREIEIQTGSYGRLQGNFDLSGPISADNTVFYRLTGLLREAGTEIDAVKDDRIFIAPAVTWRPNDATTLTVLGEFMDSTTGGTAAYLNDYATDAAGNPTSLSIGATRTFAGDRRYNDFRQQQGRIGYEFEHRINDMFTLRQRTRFSSLGTNQEYYFGGSGLTRENNWGIVSDTHLETRLKAGAVDHTILSGLDVSRLSYVSKQGFGVVPVGADPLLNYREEQTQTLTGIYIQDQLKWRNWRLTLGGRHDWLSSEFDTAGLQFDQDDSKFTGRAALGYVTDFGLAPYVSWGTSFTPNPGTVLGGTVAEPTTGEQIELGVKYDLPGINASLRAAVFDIRQENAVVYQVIDATNQQVQLDLRSQGFELEGVASLTDGLNVQASYSYIDARIEKLTPETVGNRLTSVPYHTAALWLDYTVQGGSARGLGIAGGVRYVGSSAGDNLNRPIIENAPRAYLDAAIRYDLENLDPSLKGLRFQVNATNLLDEDGQVCTSNYCYWDEGRKVIASLRYRW